MSAAIETHKRNEEKSWAERSPFSRDPANYVQIWGKGWSGSVQLANRFVHITNSADTYFPVAFEANELCGLHVEVARRLICIRAKCPCWPYAVYKCPALKSHWPSEHKTLIKK